MQQIDRLIEYFQLKGFKWYSSIEESLGLGKGTISAAKRRKSNLSGSTIEIIQKKCPDLSMEWLINGVGDMLNSKANTDLIAKAVENQQLKYEKAKAEFLGQSPIEDQVQSSTYWKEKFIELSIKHMALHEEHKALLEEIAGRKKTG
jgi:hypothetical protein